MYKRVLLKLSGEALSDASHSLSQDIIDNTVKSVIALAETGLEIGIVVGGGNILRGRSSTCVDHNKADQMGMLATAINSLALQDAFEKFNHKCVVLSSVEMPVFCERYTSRAALNYLKSGYVVIFACGTGSPFFTTDTGAALKAAEIGADVLLLAKNIDAVYSDDPKIDHNAVRYNHLSYNKVINDNLKATDITAITLCKEQNIPIHVFALKDLKNISDGNTAIGTTIDNTEY